MFGDETRRAATGEDASLRSLAVALFELLTAFDDTPFSLDHKRWKIAGYRLGKYLARVEDEKRRRGGSPELVRELADGMAASCDEEARMLPVVYDAGRSAELEDKARKLLALASHPSTGDGERSAAERGLRKLLESNELAIVPKARLEYVENRVRQLDDVVRFIRARHPGILLF